MFFLSDYDVSEYRKLGSKDKTPRKRNWKKTLAYGALGIGGLAASGLLLRSAAKGLYKTNKNVAKHVQDNIPNVTTRPNVTTSKVPQQPSSSVKAWSEEAKKNYDNPNYVWEFNNGELTTFARGRDRKKRAKRMGRFGAKVRVGTVGALGSGVLGTAGYIVGGKKGAMIGAGLGGTLGTAGSYLEHRNSAYSPTGKKKWKNYKQPPKWYGIPTDKLDLIGE